MDNLTDVKNATITNINIIKIGGYYRFINHDNQLMTTGFKTKEKLLEYKNNIRFDNNTIKIMKERYEFNKG